MIDRLAERYGLDVVETPVGFNHIADEMMVGDVIMGGEESGGMSVQGHIPEGDGILTSLLLLEVMADSGLALRELVDNLLEDVGPAQYARKDLRLSRPVSKDSMVEMLVNNAPTSINGRSIERIQTNDGVKYYLADGSWLLIRPSGTEPVLRVYAEAPDDARVATLLEFGQEVAAKA